MSRNLLAYPLYKISGKESEYQKHKKFVDKNIEIVKKFDCVDDIIVLGKEVESWSEMISDILLSIKDLVSGKSNVLFSEADTIFTKSFSEIYSLEKFMMFSKCQENSNIDSTLTKEYYFNGGFIYYPHNMDSELWKHVEDIDKYDSIKMTGNLYEVIMNRMYYSQFPSIDHGLKYLENFGIFKYNWCIRSPAIMDQLRHIHFLNMSHYTCDESKFSGFWYEDFFDRIYKLVINDCLSDSIIIELQNYYDLKV